MSTRSCIARPVGDEWEGRYHHSDGYPEGLGAELWKLVQAWGVETARVRLIDEHPAGWSCILGADWSSPAGYSSTYPRPLTQGPRCYCHGERSESASLIRSRDEKRDHTAALFIEWVYVLGAVGLTVYGHRAATEITRGKYKGTHKYEWVYLDTFPWAGPEPVWTSIERPDDVPNSIDTHPAAL